MKEKILVSLMVVMTITILIGCESSPLVGTVNGTFELEHGQTVFVTGPNVRLTFSGDVYDGRCGTQHQCYWQGYASITLRLEQNNQSTEFKLGTLGLGGSIPPEYFDTLGYRFTLTSLEPYPVTGSYPNERYVATITVTRDSVVTIMPLVQIVDTQPSGIEVNPYNLDSARIDGDKITMWVNYGGGCEQHYFQLFMSPAAFLESNPEQANLYLRHFGPPDYCKAFVHQKIEFGLNPIIQMYYSTVSGGGGELRLNLINCTDPSQPPMPCDDDWFGTLYVPYFPD